jgi:HlyD family secretion protein
LLAAVCGGGYWAIQSAMAGKTKQYDNLVTETVSRGAFSITVTDNGELDSLQNITLTNRVEKPTTILSIVLEGTSVQAPVVSEIDGEVSAIQTRAEKEQVVTVRRAPVVAQMPGLLLYIEPQTAEHYVHLGDNTKLSVEIGDRVKVGEYLAADVVCELDSADYREQAKQQQIELTQAIAALLQAGENVEIQRAQNESDIAAAELAITLAGLALTEYKEGDFLQLQNELNGKIQLAQVELITAEEFYQFTKRISKKGYRTRNEVEAARFSVTKAEIALKDAKQKLNVLEKYTSKGELAKRGADAKETILELKRVERKASAALSQYQADYKARKLTAEVEQDKYDRLVQQIEVCTLRAPQEGQVVYAKPNSRSREVFTIEEGASVRERQAIIKLPDMTQMKVEAGIHESRISMVRTELPVRIRVEAYPNEIFHGVVATVSSVPTPGRWPNMDLKEYPIAIRLTDSMEKIERLKPGLTAQIEIIVKQRTDVLQVPVQSVISIGEKRVTFVLGEKGPERRDLKIGESSDTAVEILEGVKDGEQIVMNPRTHFADQIQALEAEEKAAESASEEEQAAIQSATKKPQTDKKNTQPDKKAAQPERRSGAGGGGGDPSAFFKRMDKNGDGKLAADELSGLPEQMKQGFSKLDENGDGSIDKAEFAKRPQRGGGRPQ